MIAIESQYATLARDLAEALMDAGYSRKSEDKKRVGDLHMQIVALRRREVAEAEIEKMEGIEP